MTFDQQSKRHSWNDNEIKQYGDARCSNCQMKYSYYLESIGTLNSWTEEERKGSEWNEKMEWYKTCH